MKKDKELPWPDLYYEEAVTKVSEREFPDSQSVLSFFRQQMELSRIWTLGTTGVLDFPLFDANFPKEAKRGGFYYLMVLAAVQKAHKLGLMKVLVDDGLKKRKGKELEGTAKISSGTTKKPRSGGKRRIVRRRSRRKSNFVVKNYGPGGDLPISIRIYPHRSTVPAKLKTYMECLGKPFTINAIEEELGRGRSRGVGRLARRLHLNKLGEGALGTFLNNSRRQAEADSKSGTTRWGSAGDRKIRGRAGEVRKEMTVSRLAQAYCRANRLDFTLNNLEELIRKVGGEERFARKAGVRRRDFPKFRIFLRKQREKAK